MHHYLGAASAMIGGGRELNSAPVALLNRAGFANGNLAERLAYLPPIQPRQTIISPFVPAPLFQRAA